MTEILSNNNDEKVYKCKYKNCYMIIKTEKLFTKHKKYHEKYQENVYTCSICTRSFVVEQYYQTHMLNHDKDAIKCTVCDSTFRDEMKVREHSAAHQTHKFRCELCDEICTCRRTLNLHILKTHSFKSIEPFYSAPVASIAHNVTKNNKPITIANKKVNKSKSKLKTVTESKLLSKRRVESKSSLKKPVKSKLTLKKATECKLPLETATEKKLPLKKVTKTKLPLKRATESKLSKTVTKCKLKQLSVVNKEVALAKEKGINDLVQHKQLESKQTTKQDNYKNKQCSEIPHHNNLNPSRRKSARLYEKEAHTDEKSSVEETGILNVSTMCRNLHNRRTSSASDSSNKSSVDAKSVHGDTLLKDKKESEEYCQLSRGNKKIVKQWEPDLQTEYTKSELKEHKSSLFELDKKIIVTKKNNKISFNTRKNKTNENNLIKDEILDLPYKKNEVFSMHNNSSKLTVNSELINIPSDKINQVCKENVIKTEKSSSVFEHIFIQNNMNINNMASEVKSSETSKENLIKGKSFNSQSKHEVSYLVSNQNNVSIVNNNLNNISTNINKESLDTESISKESNVNIGKLKENDQCLYKESPFPNVPHYSENNLNENCVVMCTLNDKTECNPDNMVRESISTVPAMIKSAIIISDQPNVITEKHVNNESLIENGEIEEHTNKFLNENESTEKHDDSNWVERIRELDDNSCSNENERTKNKNNISFIGNKKMKKEDNEDSLTKNEMLKKQDNDSLIELPENTVIVYDQPNVIAENQDNNDSLLESEILGRQNNNSVSSNKNEIIEKQENKYSLNIKKIEKQDNISLIENERTRSSNDMKTFISNEKNVVTVKEEPCDTFFINGENEYCKSVSEKYGKEDNSETVTLSSQNKGPLKRSSFRKNNFNENKIKKKVRFNVDKLSSVSEQNLFSQNDIISSQDISPEKLKIIIQRDKLTGNIISSSIYKNDCSVINKNDKKMKNEQGLTNISTESKERDQCKEKKATQDSVIDKPLKNKTDKCKNNYFFKSKSKNVKLNNLAKESEEDFQHSKNILKQELFKISPDSKSNENIGIKNSYLGLSCKSKDTSASQNLISEGNFFTIKEEPFILSADDIKSEFAESKLMNMKSILKTEPEPNFLCNRFAVKQESLNTSFNVNKYIQNIDVNDSLEECSVKTKELLPVHDSSALNSSFKIPQNTKKRKLSENDLPWKIVKKSVLIKDKSFDFKEGQISMEKPANACKSKCEELLSTSLLADIYELEKKYSVDVSDHSTSSETLQNVSQVSDLNRLSNTSSVGIRCKSYDRILKGLLLESSNYMPSNYIANKDKYSESRECNSETLNNKRAVNLSLEDNNNKNEDLSLNLFHPLNNVKTGTQLCNTYNNLQNPKKSTNMSKHSCDIPVKIRESLLLPPAEEKSGFISRNYSNINYVERCWDNSLKPDFKTPQNFTTRVNNSCQSKHLSRLMFLHSNSVPNIDKCEEIGKSLSNNSQSPKYWGVIISDDVKNSLCNVNGQLTDEQIVSHVLYQYNNKIVNQQSSSESSYDKFSNRLSIIKSDDKSYQYVECPNGLKKYINVTTYGQAFGKVMDTVPDNVAASTKTKLFVNGKSRINGVCEELSKVANLTVKNTCDNINNKDTLKGYIPETDRTSSYDESIEAVVKQQNINENNMLKCNFCGMKKITEFSLLEHLRLHYAPCPYRCDVCGKSYIQKRHLERHKRTHPVSIEFRHRKVLASSSNSDSHVQRHPSFSYFICEKCGETFIDELHLNKHLLAHS